MDNINEFDQLPTQLQVGDYGLVKSEVPEQSFVFSKVKLNFDGENFVFDLTEQKDLHANLQEYALEKNVKFFLLFDLEESAQVNADKYTGAMLYLHNTIPWEHVVVSRSQLTEEAEGVQVSFSYEYVNLNLDLDNFNKGETVNYGSGNRDYFLISYIAKQVLTQELFEFTPPSGDYLRHKKMILRCREAFTQYLDKLIENNKSKDKVSYQEYGNGLIIKINEEEKYLIYTSNLAITKESTSSTNSYPYLLMHERSAAYLYWKKSGNPLPVYIVCLEIRKDKELDQEQEIRRQIYFVTYKYINANGEAEAGRNRHKIPENFNELTDYTLSNEPYFYGPAGNGNEYFVRYYVNKEHLFSFLEATNVDNLQDLPNTKKKYASMFKDSLAILSETSDTEGFEDVEYVEDSEDIFAKPVQNDEDLRFKPHQRIFFGAPGTGKSYSLNKEAKDCFTRIYSEGNDYDESLNQCIARITFHPNYSYAHFVGSYKPVTDKDGNIKYEFVPGVFLKHLVEAINNEDKNYLLIIEEINRAQVSAVFGDIFQLLDRNEAGDSVYRLAIPEDMAGYLQKHISDFDPLENQLYLPKNFYIWATMNSADQGVFPMDTAFKRRWNFEYVDLDNGRNSKNKGFNFEVSLVHNNTKISVTLTWNEFREAINEDLSKLSVPEDKLLGYFFVNEKGLERLPAEKRLQEGQKLILDKVITYLYDDVAKALRSKVFNTTECPRYGSLRKTFNENFSKVFNFTNMTKLKYLLDSKLEEIQAKIEEAKAEEAKAEEAKAEEVKTEEVIS
ncbi:hypothetical protein CKF54_03990 [Psittacicella hinzii]|uniref:ATPase dynein-related AAA domain-containing protein n=1 Tax=Psittacicella hinzii TaxID=2028575 RepID=A0A3A1Y3F2_9GAMM|nr:AAA family ATPase [Psittacicella hinzii]RIY32862.1 hypothetical protein CKF54_03990 [Psittacicella hinzii]